jgi:melanoma-associated antigen p97
VPAQQGAQQLANCTSLLSGANTNQVSFSCVAGGSIYGCFSALARGDADIVSSSGEQAYTANQDYRLLPIAGEGRPGLDNLTNYYSVAVVNAAFCEGTTNKTYADLEGLKSCHTGYQRTAGWDMAVGTLLASGAMPVVSDLPSVTDDAESIASFFSGGVCAGREASYQETNAPVVSADGNGTQYQPLCSACAGACDETDPYFDYQGTVRGLTEGACDVAWTNHTVFSQYALGGPQAQNWSTKAASDFRILCSTGGCATLDQASTCNNARVPSRAILASPAFAASTSLPAVQSALVTAAGNATFRRSVSNINGVSNVLVSSTADRLTAVTPTLQSFLAPSTQAAFSALNQVPGYFGGGGNKTYGRLAICVETEEAKTYCDGVAQLLNASDSGFSWTCGLPTNRTGGCVQSVARNETDFLVTGSAGAYDAYTAYNLRAIAAEDYGTGQAAAYYSVGVVRAEYCETPAAAQGFAGLRGKSSCHTGYGRTAGWTMPTGFLAMNGLISATNVPAGVSGDAAAMAAFFDNQCAANNNTNGPLRLPSGSTAPWPELCQACGDPATCNSNDTYWDYDGSFRGVVDGQCDVSFTRETDAVDNSVGGKANATWAQPASNFRLLCPTGGCKNLDEYAECTAAKVPSRAVLVRPTYQYTKELQTALIRMRQNPEVAALVFNATGNPKNLVFQARVQNFIPILSSTPAWLGQSGRAIQAVANLRNGVSMAASAPASTQPVAMSGRRLLQA